MPYTLLMANRIDPPLPLTSLRAKGEMTEIRVQDLRFSLEETAEFMHKMMVKKLEDGIFALMGKKTEGWVLLIVLLVFVIFDLDRPRRCLIEVRQESLTELQASSRKRDQTVDNR